MTLLGATDIPPQDIGAEACVIGSLILDPATLPAIRAAMTDDDFFRPAHRDIFAAAAWIAEHPQKWGTLDLVTLKNALIERGSLQRVVGKETAADAIDYLYSLVDGTPSAANAAYYAKIVGDKARRRRAIQAGNALVAAAKADGDTDEALLAAAPQVESALRIPTVRSDTPSRDVRHVIEEVIAGRRVSLDWPWPILTKLAKPCAPGSVTVICGDPGSQKSFSLQEAFLYWSEQGVPIAMLHLEKDRRYHLGRALAQLEGNGKMTDENWQKEHAAEIRDAEERHREAIDAYGRCMWDAQGIEDVTIVWATQWVRARAAEGARVIGVDPVTAADSGREPWAADRRFIQTCEAVAARYGCSIVLVTHPRTQPGQKPTLDSLAGGKSYARLTDVVLWVVVHDPAEEGTIETKFGPAEMQYTNHIAMFKTRDSTGRGTHIAYNFDRTSLRMQELGPIVKDDKK